MCRLPPRIRHSILTYLGPPYDLIVKLLYGCGLRLFECLQLRKYRKASKEFIWQWFFPAKNLTRLPDTGKYRRYYLHETHVQRAIKEAVGEARICKRATVHTFRHNGDYTQLRIIGTVLPAIYYRLIMTFVPFKNYWAIAICELLWFIHIRLRARLWKKRKVLLIFRRWKSWTSKIWIPDSSG